MMKFSDNNHALAGFVCQSTEEIDPGQACTQTNDQARLFNLKYKLLSIIGTDCLLVCPYLTHAGSISGILVVLVTKNIMQRTS
jgi:hypothetical protein